MIWKMGTNKWRLELCPLVELGNGQVLISHCALEQARQLWASLLMNGGMCYTNIQDKLSNAMNRRNEVFSSLLVKTLRDKLRGHYDSSFDEIDVDYERVFGKREVDYGDFDIMFYSPTAQELFLIEAKFMSDSLTSRTMMA